MSEYVLVRQESLYKPPDNVSLEVGGKFDFFPQFNAFALTPFHQALIEPLAVGWHAVKVSPFKKGDVVVVLGGGPIGLSVIQALKAKGPAKLIVSEVAEVGKSFATHFGATHIIDPLQEDFVARVRALSDGRGADVIFDAAGIQSAVD